MIAVGSLRKERKLIKINKNVYDKLEEAKDADSYFITITILQDGQLRHYQRQQGFPKEDLLPSLDEIKKLVLKGMN